MFRLKRFAGAVSGGRRLCSSSASVLVALLISVGHTFSLSQSNFVDTAPSPGSLAIVQHRVAETIYVDTNDHAGVICVAHDLKTDITRVTGVSPMITHELGGLGTNAILVGTVGRSALIDRLVKEQRSDVAEVAGQWEATLVQVIQQPFPGVEVALVIAGSDRRGTIYGVYDLSEQMGVSPWYWWAHVPVKHHEALFVKRGRRVQGPPTVKYRGIFINDGGPSLMTWTRQKYGELNQGLYTNVFELILRLKGNYLWPVMWPNPPLRIEP